MSPIGRPGAMWVWALRDIGRHPAYHALVFLVLLLLIVPAGVVTLVGQGVDRAVTILMERSPAVVIRRVGPMGWAPMPVNQAVALAAGVVGVIRPRPRIWGVATTARGPVTVVGLDEVDHPLPDGFDPPQPGKALAGSGIEPDTTDGRIMLHGAATISVFVSGRLPESADPAVHDVLVLHPADARRLLGLSPGLASDLVVDVYHDFEIDPVCAALTKALPWPVHLDTRPDALRRLRGQAARHTGMGLAAGIPLTTAFVLLVVAQGIGGHARRRESGLYKALGWTGGDLMRLNVYIALLVGLPAVSIGSSAACLLIRRPVVTWMAQVFWGWSGSSPVLLLSTAEAVGIGMLAAAAVVLPFMTASLWAGWQGVRRDPAELLGGGA